MRWRPSPSTAPLLATCGVFALVAGAMGLRHPGFASWFQFNALLADNAPLGLCALGMTFVILGGGIDLSVGAVVALASMLLARALTAWDVPPGLAVAGVVACGATFGAAMGALVELGRLPPFLVTLAGMFLARGGALLLTPQKRVSLAGDAFAARFAETRVGALDLAALVLLGAWLIALVLASRTRFGRVVVASGSDENAARLMGLPVRRARVGAYALCGLCAAAGGVVQALGTGAGDATIGNMLELDAIAAVVIGGTLLRGGVGHPFGTLLGVLVLGVIATVPSYEGDWNSWWTRIAVGALVLAFVVLQRALRGLAGSGSRRSTEA